jgi:UDP-N-acetylmuramate--alanine ligase
VLKRADFLRELMAGMTTIAIAGTHGKTSTTAMISWMLYQLDLDPSFILGGVISGLGVNARAGKGPAFVIEADEYDRMFLGLTPQIAVITNIEHDHPDCYPTAEEFLDAFRSFIDRLTLGSVLVLCGDDPGARQLLNYAFSKSVTVVTYGSHEPANDYRAVQVELGKDHLGFDFQLRYRDRVLASVSLQVPGMHSVLNASAALVVADQMGLPIIPAAKALGSYRGTQRRFEVIGVRGGITVISDYAHHPTEIQATLSAARTRFPHRQIWAVWQPHTFSRTRLLFDSFAESFTDADHVLVTEIYAAREPLDEGFSASQFINAMSHPHAVYISDLMDAVSFLEKNLKTGDVLIVLSAGDAHNICAHVLNALGEKGLEFENG